MSTICLETITKAKICTKIFKLRIEDLSTFTKEDKLVNRLSVLISAALRAA